MPGTYARNMDVALNSITQNPDWLECLADYMRKLKTGFFNGRLVDVVFQKWRTGESLTLGEVYAFASIHALINTGKIAVVTLNVHQTPYADKDIERNHQVLSTVLPALDCIVSRDDNDDAEDDTACKWNGGFWGGTQGEDGFIDWKGSAQFELFRNGKPAGFQHFPSGRVILEVGYTEAAKTLAQIRSNGGVARWPYDHEEITILKAVNPKAMQRGCRLL